MSGRGAEGVAWVGVYGRRGHERQGTRASTSVFSAPEEARKGAGRAEAPPEESSEGAGASVPRRQMATAVARRCLGSAAAARAASRRLLRARREVGCG